MNTFDRQHNNLSEDQLDSLLRDFFAAEMPVEVYELADPPVVRKAPDVISRPLRTPGRKSAGVARVVGMAMAIAAVLLLAWGVTPVAPPDRPDNLAETPVPPNSRVPSDSIATDVREDASREVSHADRRSPQYTQFPIPSHAVPYVQSENVALLGPRKYATDQGSVEQRTQVRTTNLSFYEPKSGSQVCLEVPEIEIEILAARDDGI